MQYSAVQNLLQVLGLSAQSRFGRFGSLLLRRLVALHFGYYVGLEGGDGGGNGAAQLSLTGSEFVSDLCDVSALL